MDVMQVGTELWNITAVVTRSAIRHNSLNMRDSYHKVVD